MKKNICPACASGVAHDAIYCSKCGADINPNTKAYFCILCGQPLDDDANYCSYCREPVPYASGRINDLQSINHDRSSLCIVSFAIDQKKYGSGA